MKKNQPQMYNYVFLLGCLAIICCCIILGSCSKQDKGIVAKQAYELRMKGKADSAEVLLTKAVTDDPDNAIAWYELARTKHHIGLGDPRVLFGSLDNLEQTIQKAIDNDPESIIYQFYDGYFGFLRTYVALMGQQPEVRDRIQEVVSIYEGVLAQKPDYIEAMLYLVEILAIPPTMGGNPSKAAEYATKLESLDPIAAAKARELLLGEGADRIGFWQKIVEDHPGNAEALEQLGKTYLYQEQPEEGLKLLEEALKANPEQKMLILDMARFYLISSMQDSARKEVYLPKADAEILRYLETEPIRPLKAYALELSAKVKFGMGDDEGAMKLREQAAELDPYYSKAFGLPPMLLYTPPDEIVLFHSYFFRPF